MGAQDKVYLEGDYSGEVGACFNKGVLAELTGFFNSASQGLIRIEKEMAFDFLKQRLDKKSYEALVDSFRNYTYNKGNISISKQEDVISVHLDFNSESAGRRDIIVNYHILGGVRQ